MTHFPDGGVDRRLIASWEVLGGVDEVGRGALAGPVAVGLVVVDGQCGSGPEGVADSKALSPRVRASLVGPIREWARASAVGWSTPTEICDWGVTEALRVAALRALAQVGRQVASQGGAALGGILLDGKHDYITGSAPSLFSRAEGTPDDPWADGGTLPVATMVQADRHSVAVAAASIIAKVARDTYMESIADPGYGWASNKGYGSKQHILGLEKLGPSARHRRCWRLPGVN